MKIGIFVCRTSEGFIANISLHPGDATVSEMAVENTKGTGKQHNNVKINHDLSKQHVYIRPLQSFLLFLSFFLSFFLSSVL